MRIESLLILVFIYALVKSQESQTDLEIEPESCFYVYDCCKKEGIECIEYCEPIIACKNNSTRELTGHEGIADTKIISTNCRKGYR